MKSITHPKRAPQRQKAHRDCPICGISFACEPKDIQKCCSRRCAAIAKTRPLAEKFWEKVDKTSSPNGCWLWTSSTNGKGYGIFKAGIAHRVAWKLCVGPIHDGMFVCHDCPGGDNPACVNPAHLWLGTNAENMADMVAKGRSTAGERSHSAKLTWEQVAEIRAMYATGKYTRVYLARQFNISPTQIFGIVHNLKWRK